MAVTERLRRDVIERDAKYFWGHMTYEQWPNSYASWRRAWRIVCLVPLLDPDNPYKCGGKQEVDHVKDQPMMGKRAPDDAEHLVAMCQEHNTWHPPRKELRQAERDYLKRYKARTTGDATTST